MTVAMILKDKGSKVHTISSDVSVEEATRRLRELHVGALVAMAGDGKITGVFSERDLVRAIHHEGGAALGKPISTFMTKNVVTARCEDTLDELMSRMTSRRIRHLPVIKGGELVGIVSIGDLVKARIAETESEAEALKQYISAG
jgi:CBS domain-containing protein